MSRRFWTDEELGYLQDDSLTIEEIALELGRSCASVSTMRLKMRDGFVSSRQGWSDAEMEIIASTIHSKLSTVLPMLPGRSAANVKWKRSTFAKANDVSMLKNSDPYAIGARPIIAKTCKTCGLLLPAKNFSRGANGRWPVSCNECSFSRMRDSEQPDEARERDRSSVRAYKAKINSMAIRKGFLWVESDFEILSNPDLTIAQKALRLSRTFDGTASALIRFGFPSFHPVGDAERDHWIIDNPNEQQYKETA